MTDDPTEGYPPITPEGQPPLPLIVASFNATIAYGWLALLGLILASIVDGDRPGAVLAIAAAGAAYASQLCATRLAPSLAFAFQVVSLVLAAASGIHYLGA